MKVHDFISDPNWFDPGKMEAFFNWARSPEIEQSGEGRRQLGYYDGYKGEPPASRNSDYLKGYEQGLSMRRIQ